MKISWNDSIDRVLYLEELKKYRETVKKVELDKLNDKKSNSSFEKILKEKQK